MIHIGMQMIFVLGGKGEEMIDGYDDNFSTTARPNYIVYVKPLCKPGIYITSKWLDEKKDQYANVFIDDKPLIRCKDCKYWEEESKDRFYCERTMFWTTMDADDFCSRGERKDE